MFYISFCFAHSGQIMSEGSVRNQRLTNGVCGNWHKWNSRCASGDYGFSERLVNGWPANELEQLVQVNGLQCLFVFNTTRWSNALITFNASCSVIFVKAASAIDLLFSGNKRPGPRGQLVPCKRNMKNISHVTV